MAHEVASMAYVGATPWHGLGNPLSPNQPLEVWAQQAGMNWQIEQTDVCFVATLDKPIGTLKTFDEKKVLYRSDTKEALSVVGNRYKVVQPREILEFYRDLTEVSGFALETAGVLKGGKKLWALARTGQTGMLKGNDVTEGYVLLATACDGSMATTAQFTSIRVVCNNTLAIATNNSTGAIKVPHNTVFDAQAVKKELGISVSSWDEFMYRMKLLSGRPVKHREVEKFFMKVFSESQPHVSLKAHEKNVGSVLRLFDGAGRGSNMPAAKSTAFGLLNAVTEFVDHDRRARSTDHRLESAWFGQGASLKQKALEEALLLVA